MLRCSNIEDQLESHVYAETKIHMAEFCVYAWKKLPFPVLEIFS